MRLPTVLITAALAAGLSVAGCRPSGSEPPRPAAVPAEAVWVGGADGGVFVMLNAGRDASAYAGAIYYQTGELWYQGVFVPRGWDWRLSRATASDVTAWDGTQLTLRNGGALLAEQPQRR